MILGSKKEIVGLDIGTSAIKVAVVKESSRGYNLIKLGYEPLPPQVIVEGSIMDGGVIVDAIRNVLARHKIKAKMAAISVSGNAVIVKRITTPKMDEQELRESLKWEAEQYIPFDIDDVEVDFYIQKDVMISETEMSVVLVAVKKDKINDYTSLVMQAGLEPVIVDVDGFSLEHQFEANYAVDKGEVVALIDIGAGVMNINILKDGIHMLYRDIALGGNYYTDAIQKELNLSFEQAELLKKGGKVEDVRQRDYIDVLNSIHDDISLEIQRSFDYFRATSSNDTIDRVIVTGGCSLLNNFAKVISNKLNTKVEIGNPFLNIQYNQRKIDYNLIQQSSPVFAVAIGLALRQLGDKNVN